MSEELKLYRCDPDKNDMCFKFHCYRDCFNLDPLRKHAYCRHTFYKEYEMNIWKRIKEAILWKKTKRK